MGMTKKQSTYYRLYKSGKTMEEIAKMLGRNKSTVSRMIKMAERHVCQISENCTECQLPECAIEDKRYCGK